MSTTSATPTTTTLGTPCARSWSGEWIATVNATESKLNHRICGARLPDGTPCTRTTDHPSGRCRFHGGFDLTGAPQGNRNHIIHGLYSRRLRTCSPNCPFWQTCPCANQDSSDRSTPTDPSYSPSTPSTSSTPLCPYQLTEYNTVLTDALAIVESQPHPNPMGLHAAHNVALLQVLISNAAIQL
ncbi:MAG: HGGxSTG domain-containing protein, partial [Candidatus Hydrogenedentales bacterium]